MRTTATCPKCSGKKIVVAELRQPFPGTIARLIPALALNTMPEPSDALVVKKVGGFESWICAACGYTEFYAKDLGDVDRLAVEHPEHVRIVDATVHERGPFR